MSQLQKQLEFIIEIDRLKSVLRRTGLMDGSRRENSAEHSWHLSMMALVLHGHANDEVDLLRVMKMLLVHDLVEIDADDTFCYDEAGMATKDEKEAQAAERLFGMVPGEQCKQLMALWHEFEARTTPESKFANALDRLQPAIANYLNDGGTWREYGITLDQVMERLGPIADGSEALWEYAKGLIDAGVRRGDIRASEKGLDGADGPG